MPTGFSTSCCSLCEQIDCTLPCPIPLHQCWCRSCDGPVQAVWETDAGQRLGAVYTFDAQREAITTASLAVECVGCLALRVGPRSLPPFVPPRHPAMKCPLKVCVVGGSAFAPLLLRVIYPLLERVSDPAAEVTAARSASNYDADLPWAQSGFPAIVGGRRCAACAARRGNRNGL